jgi:hypothetical protein
MSEDEPKSAIEIAMARLRARADYQEVVLTDQQKAEIADIRSRTRAKIAELEITQEGKLAEAMAGGAYEMLEKLQAELANEKERLNQEADQQVQKVRQREE